jgi:glucan-binding YG repeat protein
MKNKVFMLALSCMLIGTISVPAFASESVRDVYVSIVPNDDDEFSPGEIEAGFEPTTESGQYYIDEYDTSSSNFTPRKTYTYTMDILPENGYSFDSNVRVVVKGATEVTIKSKSSKKIEVKAKTYPFYVLDETSNIKIDEETKKGTWDKVDYAKKYSVVVSYTNKSGDERETKKSVTKNEIDLSGYIGKYDDVKISVQAVKGTADGDKFISNSDYILSSDGSVNNELSDDEYKFSIPTTSSDGSTTTNNNNSNSNPSGSTNTSSNDGWHGSGNSWYYAKNGKKITGWLGINGEWYLLDNNGNMKYGWQYVDNNWFYLNTVHDGTFGKMLSGWQYINDKWYYLNTVHDGTFGAMYSNRTTPDGYRVGSDGAWIR